MLAAATRAASRMAAFRPIPYIFPSSSCKTFCSRLLTSLAGLLTVCKAFPATWCGAARQPRSHSQGPRPGPQPCRHYQVARSVKKGPEAAGSPAP